MPAVSEFKDFRACPVCQEQTEQCLTCASYVVDGERIYYEKLKDFGATQDHELRFIQRIQKHRTTAFFHKGKLYIPSRQGRSVPLAIGLQWESWQEQQTIVEELQVQLKGAEERAQLTLKYKDKYRLERDELQKRVDAVKQVISKIRNGNYASDQEEGVAKFIAGMLEKALKGVVDA